MTHSTQARRKAEQDKTRRFEYGVVKIRKQGERQAKGGNNENRKVIEVRYRAESRRSAVFGIKE